MREFTSAELAEIFRRSQVCPLGAACHSSGLNWPTPSPSIAATELEIDAERAYRIAKEWDTCSEDSAVQLAQQYGLDALMQEFARRVTA